MTGRTTAEIVADLRGAVAFSHVERQRYGEAADRLAELDAECIAAEQRATQRLVELHKIDTLRLPCPCGGTQRVAYTEDDHPPRLHHGKPCPDCKDGRMSHDQGWAIVAHIRDTMPTLWLSIVGQVMR